MEIETHYAHYLYIKGSSEYGGSDWEKGSKGGDSRILSIIHLEDYVDNKGNLIDGMIVDLLDTYLEFHVVTAFKQDDYENLHNLYCIFIVLFNDGCSKLLL